MLRADADTKVSPNAMSISCFVHDEEIMGLGGETKIANKAVTMIQGLCLYLSFCWFVELSFVNSARILRSQHMTEAFSMYKIKGDSGH